MKLITLLTASLIGMIAAFAAPPYKNSKLPHETRVQDLLSRMTLDEKIGQLSCPLGWEMYDKIDGDSVQPSQKFIEQMRHKPVGAFWATLRADPWTKKTLANGLNPELSAKALNALQKHAVEHTRLGIPIFFAEECVHGHMAIGATVFPTGIGMASTWNQALMEEMASAIGLEARLQGAHIAYGPVLDLAREPRWSRVEETMGEDPVLSGQMGVAFVKGLQGADPADGKHIYSTLKHFAAYGIPAGGHNGGQAFVGERELLQNHLLPFEMAVEAGAATVMTSYNAINGIPCTANSFLLNDLLKDKWNFGGFVFSDLGSIEGIASSHRVAPDIKNAASMALNAGVEMDLGGNAYGKNLRQAVEENLVSEATIDSAVCRILRLKFRMGLFENPYVDPSLAAASVRSSDHKELARKVARQGIVLLKNSDNLLPLSKSVKSIAVIGPNANNVYNQLGDYTAPQPPDGVVTVLEGIRSVVSKSTQVRYVKGCAVRDTTQQNIAEAVQATLASDVTVLVLGGSSARDFKTEYIETGAAQVSEGSGSIISDMESGEGYDRSSLRLMGLQETLLEALAATGKPLVVIYIQGRPLDMSIASEKASALLTAWYPGQEGGSAVADVLFGDYNPSGRLPVTVPRSVGQLPVYYSLGRQNDYVDEKSAPLYAFGYGLSYTLFDYAGLSVAKDGGNVRISFSVKNVGTCDGEEVVQLYLRDNVSSVYTSPIQLKDFAKVHVKKGESKTVEFVLTEQQLGLYNQQMEFVVEPGEFSVFIGAASNDIRLKGSFEY